MRGIGLRHTGRHQLPAVRPAPHHSAGSRRRRPGTWALCVLGLLCLAGVTYLAVYRGRISKQVQHWRHTAGRTTAAEQDHLGEQHQPHDWLLPALGSKPQPAHEEDWQAALHTSGAPGCSGFRGIQLQGTSLKELTIPVSADAATDCCKACREHAAANDASTGSSSSSSSYAGGGVSSGAVASSPGCNAWVYCGDAARCKERAGACALLRVVDPTRPDMRLSGPDVHFTSGVVVRPHDIEQLYAARNLQLIRGRDLILGLRDTTATVAALSPQVDPSFSFTLPHDALVLNSSDGGFHHLGDVTLRVRPVVAADAAPQQYRTLTTVSYAHKPPPPVIRLSHDSPTTEADPGRLAWVDVSPQLPPDSPVSVERWLELPPKLADGKSDGSISASSGRTCAGSGSPFLPGEVRMWWKVTNTQQEAGLEVGALGLSMPMNQVFNNLNLERVSVQCSFVEAYVGGHFGYLQVTKASGAGPTLLVLPAPGTSFEAWRPLGGDDRTDRGFSFEGHNELLVHSHAWAHNEWSNAQQWVPPTSRVLKKGQSAMVGVRLVLAAGPEQVEAALTAAGHPVVIGVPSFIIHADNADARVYIRMPPGLELLKLEPHPAGSLELTTAPLPGPAHGCGRAGKLATVLAYRLRVGRGPGGTSRPLTSAASASAGHEAAGQGAAALDAMDWSGCSADGVANKGHPAAAGRGPACPTFTGRVRLRLSYRWKSAFTGRKGGGDGGGGGTGCTAGETLEQYVQVLALPPARALVRAFGNASSDPVKGWLPESARDPWGRSPGFMGTDRDTSTKLTQELRVYMSGLSDEAGAAQPLAVAVKQLGLPSADEVDKLEAYVHETLFQGNHSDPRRFIQASSNYSVRASLFYFPTNSSGDMAEFEKAAPEMMRKCRAGVWWLICWSEARSREIWRAYNYPHVAAVYWSLYRLSRVGQPALTKRATWDWYLKQAVATSEAMWRHGSGYGRWGLMVGSIFEKILTDVELEGWSDDAKRLRAVMEHRVEYWQSLTFPFGSEMSWDNTGHEEIYVWLNRMGDRVGAEATVRAVTAYTGLFPHWALAGSARRWWDFFINGKTDIGNDRALHHYAAALNAVPVAEQFRRHPDRLFLLRLSAAGTGGSLSNIRPDGLASMGFHGHPSLLRHDAYSADYGIGFYGHWSQSTATLACDSALGWLCFNCDLSPVRPSTFHRLYRVAGGRDVCRATRPTLLMHPRDAFRRHVLLAPLGLSIRMDAGGLADVTWDALAMAILVTVEAHAGVETRVAVLTVQRTAERGHVAIEWGEGEPTVLCDAADGSRSSGGSSTASAGITRTATHVMGTAQGRRRHYSDGWLSAGSGTAGWAACPTADRRGLGAYLVSLQAGAGSPDAAGPRLGRQVVIRLPHHT